MTQPFYKLTHDEWMRSQALRPAERDLLFYLKTRDPFGDGIELTITQIAADLERNKGTISRALKALTEQGWIDLEMVKVKVKVLSPHNTVVSTQRALSPHNESGRETTFEAVTQRALSPHNNRSPEASDSKGSDSSKTNKTYQTFTDSLTPETRERFEKFAFWKIEQSGLKIASKKAWLNKHHEEYWEEFKEKYLPEESDNKATLSPVLREKIRAALDAGQIKIERYYSGGKFIDGVRDKDRGFFETVEAWDNASN